MVSTERTEVQFISEHRARREMLNAVVGLFAGMFGTAFFLVAFVGSPPSTGADVYYALMWIIAFALVVLALLRNVVVSIIFRRTSHSTFLSLVYFNRN